MRFSNTVHTRYTVRQNISLGVAVDCGCICYLQHRKKLVKRIQIDNINLYNLGHSWYDKNVLPVHWLHVSSITGKQFTLLIHCSNVVLCS